MQAPIGPLAAYNMLVALGAAVKSGFDAPNRTVDS